MQTTDRSRTGVTSGRAGSAVSSYLSVCGIRIHYKVKGAGEQLLLLHGWGSSIESMAPVFDGIEGSYTVFAIDFPGHGKSDLPTKPWGVSEYTECLVEIMDILGLERPHILAHSFGGRVTIRLAKYYPQRVNKVCSHKILI
jgi:pimeloyl-ACP methyl ester carboxylesterase